MQFGPCRSCGRIIPITESADECAACQILSLDNSYSDHEEEEGSPLSSRDEQTEHSVIEEESTVRSTDFDRQAFLRQFAPNLLQRFLGLLGDEEDGSQVKGASDADIAALKRRRLQELDDPECRTECAICTETFETIELTRLPCNHEYHSECVHHWLKLNASCPMCRQPISGEEEEEEEEKEEEEEAPQQGDEDVDLIIMRREMADRMYQNNAPRHYMDDID